MTYRFNNGIPNQLTQNLLPWKSISRVRYQRALSCRTS